MNAHEKAACDFFLSDYPETMPYADVKEAIFNNDSKVELWLPFAQLGEDYDVTELMDDFLDYITRHFDPKVA